MKSGDRPAESSRAPVGGGRGPDLVIIVSSELGVVTSSAPAGTELIVGRASNASLRIADSSVSRRHARVVVGSRILVEDLGSANGTRVGGRTIAARTVVETTPGTTITFGQATMLVHESVPSSSQPEAMTADTTHPPPPCDDDEPIVVDPEMKRIYELARRIADSPISVLLLGETGVGKEVLAGAVHRWSSVARGPFVELNCAALTESLLEAELFGYMQGAFTGANKAKPGLIETAKDGTLFLDEIGEMSLSTQAKILRFLENGEVMRLGGLRPVHVPVRIIAATNRDLRQRVEEGAFRADLFFRLTGITLRLPPLRERRSEIIPLAKRLLELAARRQARLAPRFSAGAVSALREYDWPGNVRELRNSVERALALCDTQEITAEALQIGEIPTAVFSVGGTSLRAAKPVEPEDDLPLGTQVAQLERERVVEALQKNDGNQSAAARDLGIARTTIIRRMKRFGLVPKS